jgi:hypothetical protein
MMTLTPVSNGVLRVKSSDTLYNGSSCTATENGMVLSTVATRESGKPGIVSTCVLIDNGHRVRTTQVFSENGALFSITTVSERRVIDSVSGAMVDISGQI